MTVVVAPAPPTSGAMDTLDAKLDILGLGQYTNILFENGFDDWETVLDITEDDLEELGFKRGHRRILQREIANSRLSYSSQDESRSPAAVPFATINPTNGEKLHERKAKRRYRWHPRADPNAPKRPKTAYVNFADHLRTDPTVASMSFVDIAREVGRRWQVMDQDSKQEWENQAAHAMQMYEEQMEAYRKTSQHQEYQDYLETFKKAPGKTTRQKLRSQNSSDAPSPRRSESYGSESSSTVLKSPPDPNDAVQREECQLALNSAMSELRRFHTENNDVQPYTQDHLPSEDVCRHAIAALMEGTGCLFHLFSINAAENLINGAYHQGSPPDDLTLAELCAAAAIGGHFDTKHVQRHVVNRLFASSCILLDNLEICDADYLRVIRVLLCFTIYSCLEKHLSARAFISAGLSIAKWKYPQLVNSGETDETIEEWRRVYQTLIFMECWLSYTLGYPTQQLSVHIQNAVEPMLSDSSLENAVHWQAVRISIIASEISAAVSQPNPISPEHVKYLAGQLDLWQRELPKALQLGTLLSPHVTSLGNYQERAILMVHILYLGAAICLYRQYIVTGEESLQFNHPISKTDPAELRQYRMDCQMAAGQIARLLGLIKSYDFWTPRCWIVIYWAYSACNVLLFGAAQCLRACVFGDTEDLLANAKTCLVTLALCGADEPIASRYLELVKPTYNALREMLNATRRIQSSEDGRHSRQEHKTRIHYLLQDGNSSPGLLNGSDVIATCNAGKAKAKVPESSTIVRHIAMLLNDPFGRAQPMPQPVIADSHIPPPPSDILFWFR